MSTTHFALDDYVSLHQAGNVTAAAQGYATILGQNPQNADAWHLSGVVALQSGKTDDAIRYMETAIQLKADNPEYYCNLAAALQLAGRPDQAAILAAQAIALDAQLGVGHFRLGKALASLGRSQEALAHFHQALSTHFDPAVTWLEIASVHGALGDFDATRSALEHTLTYAEDPVPALCQQAQLASLDHCEMSEQGLNTLIEAVVGGGASPANRHRAAQAAFALGTLFESAEAFETAFQFYLTGNEFFRRMLETRLSTNWLVERRAFAERVQRRFTQEHMNKLAATGNPSRRPFFVVGFPRSGTSLVAQILASHSRVGLAGELSTITRIATRYSTLWHDTGDGLPIATDQVPTAADEYLRELQAYDAEAAHVVDKMPANALLLGLVHVLFPTAHIVWCHRDPRDVAVSCHNILFENAQLAFETSSFDWLVESLEIYQGLFNHWHQTLPGRIHEICYEDLTSDPNSEIPRLLDACGLPFEPDCLVPSQHASSIRTASRLQVREPIYTRAQGRWRRFESWLGENFKRIHHLS